MSGKLLDEDNTDVQRFDSILALSIPDRQVFYDESSFTSTMSPRDHSNIATVLKASGDNYFVVLMNLNKDNFKDFIV